MPGREGEEADIVISQRVIDESSQSTIKRLIDALVELVTNSDDSYRRLESAGVATNNRIDVYVSRRRGGVVSEVVVTDWAEGMNLDRIEEILVFAADTSGFTSGGSIRGLFGRGLKEAIFALGSGTIESVRNGALSAVRVFREGSSHRRRIITDSHPTGESNYTRISISVTNEQIQSPVWAKLAEQFCTHFALRDICSSVRDVHLALNDTARTPALNRKRLMEYEPPQTRPVVRKNIALSEELGAASLSIDESASPLLYTRNDPCSIAGIVVKTEGIPLDNRLFGFENNEAAKYFSGSIEVPGIAQLLRRGDSSILTPSRAGLDWRTSHAIKLQTAVEDELHQLVDRKQRELETQRRSATREQYRRKLRDVCDQLNRLAENELEEIPPNGDGAPLSIDRLTIRPDVGHASEREQRRFSVYLPSNMANSGAQPNVSISLENVRGNIQSPPATITLTPSRANTEVLAGSFAISGTPKGASCTIYVAWTNQDDFAEFSVQDPRPTSPSVQRNRGLFREINFDDSNPQPTQRVSYNNGNGNITIYLHFPSVGNYLRAGGDGLGEPLGQLMCAELVAEAFSKEIARRRIETNAIPLGSEIDAYNFEINKLHHKYLEAVHQMIRSFSPTGA